MPLCGEFAPLHGLDVILAAARSLPDVPFRIVGTGQATHLMDAKPPNVEHAPWAEYERLPDADARAGCALGVFGRQCERPSG